MSDQRKNGGGKQWHNKGQAKGYVGQQWQTDPGTKDGKPHKGKGKGLPNQQWQQQGVTKGWGDNQGIKNGGQGTGWQANGGMPPQAQVSKFQGSHCHSKGTQQLECTRMRSGGQRIVSKISSQIL